MNFRYFMPVNTYFGQDCIQKNKDVLRSFGKKAMIVTGRSSARKNGALQDITQALDAIGTAWVLFDEIGENPDVETIIRAAKQAKQEDVCFLIGIGGGSPMDATKAISVLTANPDADAEILFTDAQAKALPVVEIPTTAGTGSEVTQYAILTQHEKRTKGGIAQPVFASVSFLDAKYMAALAPHITNNTAVDAMSHLVESYLTTHSNAISEKIVEMGLAYWKECIPALKAREYSAQIREKLMLASTIGGVAIAQTSTSLPHLLGYFLTYEKHIPHGRANGMVMQAYLELFGEEHEKVQRVLSILGLKSIAEMGHLMHTLLDCTETFTEEDISYYTKRAMENEAKLATFPLYPLTEEKIQEVYRKSLL